MGPEIDRPVQKALSNVNGSIKRGLFSNFCAIGDGRTLATLATLVATVALQYDTLLYQHIILHYP